MRRHLACCCCALLLLSKSGIAEERFVGPRTAFCERVQSDDVIRSISPGGELALASGRTVKLLDIRLPGEDDKRPLAWLQSLAGRRVALRTIASARDRWQRDVADVALLDEAAPIDVAQLLVAEGFAVVDAGHRNVLCRPELLLDEQRARARRIGLWASDRHRPVAANDLARLQDLVGRFALVEGVVRSVGERRERTYLNFGYNWKEDLTIAIPKRTWTTLRERGLSAAALKGRRIRARGVLEEWQGVAMEITAADMLEVLGQDITRP
jgi:Staphylococcal nuclease homologue